jgi:DNA polymerase III delta prime subunit
MQPLIELYKNSEQLHHAYLFVTHEAEELVAELKNFLEKELGMQTAGNPDVSHQQFKTLSIDEARNLFLAQARKTVSGNKKIFIIETDFITEEAQNALLKAFEEPTPGTHFFIISPQDTLLPTLRSRMHVIVHNSADKKKSSSILNLNLADRMAKVKEITDAISDEEKTKQDAIVLLNQIETELHKVGVEKSAKSLKICENAREALYDRGAPVKMILENVMLSV